MTSHPAASRQPSCPGSNGIPLRLSFNPDFPVFEKFLLPNGNDLFKAVNRILAGIERCTTVGGRYDDGDAGLSNFETAEAMDDSNRIDFPGLAYEDADFFHLRQRHCF